MCEGAGGFSLGYFVEGVKVITEKGYPGPSK